MSEFSEEFLENQVNPLDTVNSSVLQSMALFDDEQRILYGLVEAILEEAPDIESYKDVLSKQSTLVVGKFRDVATTIYENDPVGARNTVVQFWLTDDQDRADYFNDLTDDDKLLDSMSQDYIENLVDKSQQEADGDDEVFFAKLFACYGAALGLDMQTIVQRAQERHEINEMERLIIIDPDVLKEKVLKATLFAAGVSLGGLVAKLYLKK